MSDDDAARSNGGDPVDGHLPTPEPHVTPETEAYWEAAGEGRLLVGYCPDCDEHFFYPRSHCPRCAGTDVEYVEAAGTGTIHARTVVRQADGQYANAVPYVLAYVELDEGPRMLTNVVEADPEDVEVGHRVEVTYDEVPGEVALVRFRPV